MSKTFRAWKIDEPLFLPPMVGDFVAKDHLARFVLSLVRDDLGLGEITGTYGSERGQPPRRCGFSLTAAASTPRGASPRPAANGSIS